MTAGAEKQGKLRNVRSYDEVARAVVAEQLPAHSVVHIANRADADWNEVHPRADVKAVTFHRRGRHDCAAC